MSHFTGLVITTPKYPNDWENSLDKYSEHIEVPEYDAGKVSDYDKLTFLMCYYCKGNPSLEEKIYKSFVDSIQGKDGVLPFEEWVKDKPSNPTIEHYHRNLAWNYADEFIQFFKENHKDVWCDFNEFYESKGKYWNGGSWRINSEDNEWHRYSTYNPDSVYDWYVLGGRWECCLKTKSDEYVDECYLDELDLSPYEYKEGGKFRLSENYPPYCMFIDGKHYSKGDMGWFAISTNENENWEGDFKELIESLPKDSKVHLVDFHI